MQLPMSKTSEEQSLEMRLY